MVPGAQIHSRHWVGGIKVCLQMRWHGGLEWSPLHNISGYCELIHNTSAGGGACTDSKNLHSSFKHANIHQSSYKIIRRKPNWEPLMWAHCLLSECPARLPGQVATWCATTIQVVPVRSSSVHLNSIDSRPGQLYHTLPLHPCSLCKKAQGETAVSCSDWLNDRLSHALSPAGQCRKCDVLWQCSNKFPLESGNVLCLAGEVRGQLSVVC